ncbi:MAG: CHAT domain-containing tetratricopeptide repeat protein [Bacteroidia bacterium]
MISISQDFKPELKNIEADYVKGNTDLALKEILIKIKTLETNSNKNPLLLSQHYNLAGEIYYHFSDIGEAYDYWNKSYALIKNNFGTNSIYLAENYSLFARYHNFKINIDSAFYYATKSINICRAKKDIVNFIPIHKIYREYAYSLKIKKEKINYLSSREESRKYLDSALYFNTKYFPENIIYKAQILHDIGNTYTDVTGYYKTTLKNFQKATENLLKANNYYDKSLAIRKNTWGNKHDKIATLYFVKGLAYFYCYQFDSLNSVLKNYQKGLCALSPQYNDQSIYSIPNPKYHFTNPTLALTILRFKIDALYYLYLKTKDIIYLEHCYNHSIVAVELWETTFKNLKTHEIHQALEIYGAAPFDGIIPHGNEYYQLTKDIKVKQNVFKWIDLNKYSTILKYQIENKSISIKSNNATILEIQKKLQKNEAIVEYYTNAEGLICSIITKNSFDLFPINRIFKIQNKSDSLLIHLKNHNASAYSKTAKLLFDSILNPYIKNTSKEINHLIIVPHGKLSQIPFDALILNKTGNYSKADFLIEHYNISYALSCNLLFNGKENNLLNKNISAIAPEYNQYSKLPFSKELINELKSDFNVSNFKLNDTTKNNSILQISAHAFCDYKNSRNSYVLLSDNQKLYLNEISKTKLNYKLAILNACETANGDIETGEGVINFNRHLYLAGIKSTITTLWKVDDEATAKIIQDFYDELKNENNTITSLHNAKLNYIENVKSVDEYDPYYWAGLIYTGKDLTLETNHYLLYSVIGISLIIGLFLLLRKFRF